MPELRNGFAYWKNNKQKLLCYIAEIMKGNVVRYDDLGHVGLVFVTLKTRKLR